MEGPTSGAIIELVIEFLIATATTIWRTSIGLRSVKELRFDDRLAILATCLWWVGSAIFAIAGNVYRLSNLAKSQRFEIRFGALQHKAHDVVTGMVLFFVGWEVTIIFIWTLKLSILYNFMFLMGNIPGMVPHLQFATLFWATSFSGVVLYQHLKCTLVQKNWQIFPDLGNACQPSLAIASQYLLNLSDAALDIVFIVIALDFFRRAGPLVTLKHRLILSAIFSAGLLVVGLETGVLWALYTGIPGAANMWRVRRTSLQIIITNLASLYPSLLKASRNLRDRARALLPKPKPLQTTTDPNQPPQLEMDIETGPSQSDTTTELDENIDQSGPSGASSTADLLPHDERA